MPEQAVRTHTYRVGNINFIVTPVYQETRNETIFDILLKLMKADLEHN